MRIALDAMGGDHAPGPIVAGAIKAVQTDSDVHVVLVGDQAQLAPLIESVGPGKDRLEIFHCTQVVTMEDSPVAAFRQKRDNSIIRCWQLLQQKKVEAVVSAGNTGAMVAGGFMLKLFLKGVRRPGIAALMPTLQGASVIMDVGANVSPKPEHLFQYGVMGAAYARAMLKKDKPKIGLLNVGSEEAKGNDLAKDTHALFNGSHLKDSFIGNVEGRDINKGVCDVIVTDGFVGNVVLKVCEGVFDFVMKVAGKEILGALQTEKAQAQQAMMNLIQRYDYQEIGGAPLLGMDGICIICHGSSGERAIERALHMAAKYGRAKLNELIVKEIAADPQIAGSAE